MVLDLEEEVFLPEEVPQLQRLGLRALIVVMNEHLGDGPGEAAGQADQALRVLVQQRPVDAGLDVEALGKRGGDHVAEVAVAHLIAAQEDQVGVFVVHAVHPVGAAVGGDIDLAADDGLDTRRLTGFVESHGPVHDPVVGEGHGGLPQLFGARREPLRPARAVEQAILAVNM